MIYLFEALLAAAGSDINDFFQLLQLKKDDAKTPSLKTFRNQWKRLWASTLVANGEAPTLKAAFSLIAAKRAHRPPLDFCRETADKYLQQCTVSEFKSPFRMDKA
jgi:hypothetical protein